MTKTCADFSDLEIGPDGYLYLLSDKSFTIARLDDHLAGGGTAAVLEAWSFGDLGGKPEGLAFTARGRAIIGLDTRKPRRNLLLPGGQRQQDYKDFINRYEQGDPSQGYSDQEF